MFVTVACHLLTIHALSYTVMAPESEHISAVYTEMIEHSLILITMKVHASMTRHVLRDWSEIRFHIMGFRRTV